NNRVKKRNWLKFMIDRIPFAKKHTYDYLYRIAFIRSGDYLGMYMRLLLIGGLLIYFIPSDWMKLIFGMLFLYLSSYQMITLYQHFRSNMLLNLYTFVLFVIQSSVLHLLST